METKTTAIIMMAICLMSFTLAYHAGETMNISAEFTNPVYTVIGNSSDLEGMNISFGDNIITIYTVPNFKPDNFTLIFLDNQTIIKEVQIGRGHRTRYVDKNITVIQSQFIDRNITNEVEVEVIKEVPGENIFNVIEGGYNLWQVLLGAIILFIVFLLIWRLMNRPEKIAPSRYKRLEEQ